MSKNYKDKYKILLIGNRGQLGSEIEKTLKFKKYNYKALNRKQIDLTNFKKLEIFLSNEVFNLIINCAAFTNVDLAENESDLANKINAELPKFLALNCKKNNSTLIHFSTDFIFDGLKATPYIETDKTSPLNIYGYSKLKGEQNIINTFNQYIILRVSSVFGNSKKNFIYKIIKKLKIEKKFEIVDDQINTPTSSNFISFVIDILLDRLIAKDKCFGVYHAVPRGSISKYDLANYLKNYLKIKKIKLMNQELIPIKSSKLNQIVERPNYSTLNSHKLEKLLKMSFEDWTYYGNLKIKEIIDGKY